MDICFCSTNVMQSFSNIIKIFKKENYVASVLPMFSVYDKEEHEKHAAMNKWRNKVCMYPSEAKLLHEKIQHKAYGGDENIIRIVTTKS